MAPVIMGNPDRPELGEELTNSFCRTDPEIAKQFARVTFLLRQPRRPRRGRACRPWCCSAPRTSSRRRRSASTCTASCPSSRLRLLDGDRPLPEPERARGDDRRDRSVPRGGCPEQRACGERAATRRGSPRTSTRTRPAATSPRCPTARIVKVNRTFLRWTGYAREELLGRRRFQELLTAPAGSTTRRTRPLLRMQGFVNEIALDIVRRRDACCRCWSTRRRRTRSGAPLLMRITVVRRHRAAPLRAGAGAGADRERAARARTERLQRINGRACGSGAGSDRHRRGAARRAEVGVACVAAGAGSADRVDRRGSGRRVDCKNKREAHAVNSGPAALEQLRAGGDRRRCRRSSRA